MNNNRFGLPAGRGPGVVSIAVLILALGSELTGAGAAQIFKVDTSACDKVLPVLEAMRTGAPLEKTSAELDAVLEIPAYRVMFEHYNRSWRPNHLPKEVFKRMILSLRFADQYAAGENIRADAMRTKWSRFYDDLDLYRRNLRQMAATDLQALIGDAVRFAESWLPPEMTIGDFDFSIHPNGGSPGFAIGRTQGYDFFQLPRDEAGNLLWDEFAATIRHESHHLGLRIAEPASMTPAESAAFGFLGAFVGEGGATKLVGNAPGGAVPPVRAPGPRDFRFSPELAARWEEFTGREAEIFERLAATFEKALAGTLGREEMDVELRDFWLGGLIGAAYFAGAEMLGAIYHGFGKEGCFEAMRDPRRLFDLYDRAILAKPDLLSACPRLPAETIRRALGIGSSKRK